MGYYRWYRVIVRSINVEIESNIVVKFKHTTPTYRIIDRMHATERIPTRGVEYRGLWGELVCIVEDSWEKIG